MHRQVQCLVLTFLKKLLLYCQKQNCQFILSDVVIEYEKEHFPIEKPTVAELVGLSLEEKNMTQKQLAEEIGVSPSRISDYVNGRAEPTLKIASSLCKVLDIHPAAMLGL